MIIEKCVVSVIDFAKKRPVSTLILIGFFCVLSIVASVTTLRINTDSSKMLSSNLGFQIRTQALNDAFPNIKNSIVVIVRAPTPDATTDVAQRLVTELSKSRDTIKSVFSPASDPFFITNGLLYQDIEKLERDLEAINNAASFLAELRDDRSLDALASSLREALVLSANAEFDRSFLERFFVNLTDLIESRLANKPQTFSWLDAMTAAPDDADRQTILFVTPALDYSAISPVKKSRLAVEAAVASVSASVTFPVEIELTGDPILRGDELRSVATGIEYSLIISLFATFALLLLAYRSIARAILTMVGLILTLVLTTGFAAIAVGALNLVSIAFCVLLVGLGLDFSIHVLAHIEERARSGDPAPKALENTARTVGSALLLSAITTAIAFFAFIPTDFTGMSQLGLIGGVGVLIAFFVSITAIPALVTILPQYAKTRLWKNRAEPDPVRIESAPEPGDISTDFPSHRPARIHVAAALIILSAACGALYFAPEARFDADPMALRSPDSPSVKALAPLYSNPDDTPYRLSLLTDGPESATTLSARLDALEPVHKTLSLNSFLPDEQDEKLQVLEISFPSFQHIVDGEGLTLTDPDPNVSPVDGLIAQLEKETDTKGSKELLAALKKVSAANSEALVSELERDIFLHFQPLIERFKLQLNIDTIALEQIPNALKERFRDPTGQWRVEILPKGDLRDQATLDTFVDSVLAAAPQAAGAPLQIVRAGQVVSDAMVQATLTALFAVGLLCFLVLRKLVMVAAVLIPLSVAAVLTLGGSVLFGIPFNYANIIVLPLLIGLGVDSGIHLAMRRQKLGRSRELFNTSTPRAVLFSALTTIAAFASLGLSEHRGTASMGYLLTLAIACTLVSTIVLTPILLDWFHKDKKN